MPRGKATKSTGAEAGVSASKQAQHSQPDFNFQTNMNQFENTSASFDDFGSHDINFDLVDGMFDESMGNAIFGAEQNVSYHQNAESVPDVNHAKLSHYGNGPQGHMNFGSGGEYGAQSGQTGIIGGRRNQVTEQFGQITPPDEPDSFDTSSKAQSNAMQGQKEQDDIAKENRAQRARNAANKRHSKSKKRKDSAQDEEDDGDEDDGQNKTTSMQREKNRVAAAKCRAKKKATSEEMQDVHREGSKHNSMLHREVRELRDQKAFLRNSLLQHEPGVCGCHAIHCYNLAQAQQLAMGVGAIIPQPLSPSQESASSIQTPNSDASGGMFSMSGQSRQQPRRPSAHSQPHSFMHSLGPSGLSGDQMQMIDGGGGQDFSQMQQFNDFLHNSPDGNTNFTS